MTPARLQEIREYVSQEPTSDDAVVARSMIKELLLERSERLEKQTELMEQNQKLRAKQALLSGISREALKFLEGLRGLERLFVSIQEARTPSTKGDTQQETAPS